MDEEIETKPVKRKPLFSLLAFLCLVISLFLARAASARFERGEELAGYGQLGITVSFLVALLLSGLVLGQIGLIRGEKPRALPILALLLNGVVFIGIVIHMPR